MLLERQPVVIPERACRYLGLTLAEWQQREEGGRLFGRKGRLYWLVSLQLCPAIWALIIGLVSLFLHKVSHSQNDKHSHWVLSVDDLVLFGCSQ